MKYLVVAVFLFSTGFTNAESTGKRQIISMGCHTHDATCYVSISGAAVGPQSCSSTSLRWNKDEAASGKETFSLLLAAFAGDKSVSFKVSDQCYVNQNSFPTFRYLSVHRQ
jgi:hypothetical protein